MRIAERVTYEATLVLDLCVLDIDPREEVGDVRTQVRVAQPTNLCVRPAAKAGIELEDAADAIQPFAGDLALGARRFPEFPPRVGPTSDLVSDAVGWLFSVGLAEEHVVDALRIRLHVARESLEQLAHDRARLLGRVLEEHVVAVGKLHE